ncbi:MAG: restriction endonuclease subunit S [Deltaproteobacteria bacterium]|nr:restriction endonuclease subunit S [Deltaproteobacteria bacterium]
MSNLPAGYKQTEVGVIPEDWELKRLGEIVEKFVNGGTPSTKNEALWNGNIPWITGADILNQKVTEIRRHITTDAVKNSSTNVISKGNLLLVSRTGVGKLAIAPFDIAISQDFTGIYPKKESLLAEYLFRFFDFNQSLLKSQNQGTSIQGVTRETLSALSIPLPTKAEQTAIAAALSDADALIQSMEKLIAKKRLIKQGAMQKLLKPKEGWVVKKLGEIAFFTNGKAHEQFIDDAGDYIVVNSKFISTEGEVFKNASISLCPLNIGGITMVMSDIPNGKALAKCFIIPKSGKYTLNQRICALRTETLDTIFLTFVINRNKYFLAFDSGTGQTNLKKQDVLECPINLPPTKKEQIAIAKVLCDMDAEISVLETKLAKYKQVKQGMMQELLTGRTRLV